MFCGSLAKWISPCSGWARPAKAQMTCFGSAMSMSFSMSSSLGTPKASLPGAEYGLTDLLGELFRGQAGLFMPVRLHGDDPPVVRRLEHPQHAATGRFARRSTWVISAACGIPQPVWSSSTGAGYGHGQDRLVAVGHRGHVQHGTRQRGAAVEVAGILAHRALVGDFGV